MNHKEDKHMSTSCKHCRNTPAPRTEDRNSPDAHHHHDEHPHHDESCCHGASCSCHDHDGHDHDHSESGERKTIVIRLAVSAALLALGLLLPLPAWARIALYVLSWLAAGYSVALSAVKSLLRGHALDEMFLMTAASVGAFCLGEFAEGVAVMLLYQVGELFQDYAVDRSRSSIAGLMDIRPDSAHVEREGKTETILPGFVQPGEIIVVRPGEKVPLDGVIVEGRSALNTVALTGESAPRGVGEGDQALSGCVNMQGVLRIRVSRDYEDSTVSRILELVEHAGENKSRADRFITRFARVYTPVVVALAVLTALLPPLLFHGSWREWITSALTFLVISCPCALVISVPLTFFSGIGGAARRGILIKGAGYLETLARTGVAVFDKTGTLTRGVFSVTETHACRGDSHSLLALAAAAESASNHPIAQSLRDACGRMPESAAEQEEISGCGVRALVGGRRVAVGNPKLMALENVRCEPVQASGTVVHVASDGEYLGYIVIADEIKAGAKAAVETLREMGVKKNVMLTGDREQTAEAVGRALGMDEIFADLLPDGKMEKVEDLLREKDGKAALIFVGDGINDAPVLARADVGVAMGALGSDAAIEAADVVLMDDDPGKLPAAVRAARRTCAIVRQNVAFSLAVKVLVMALGAAHTVPLWAAVFADVGVCFLAILNAMRAMRMPG